MTTIARARARALTTGVALLALSLSGAAVALGPAVAQEEGDDAFEDDGGDFEDDDFDEGGGEDFGEAPPDAEELDLEITESALFASPVTDALPPTLTESVPPQAVCVVRPELCPEGLQPVSDGLTGAIGTAQEEMEVAPVHPIPPDTVAASYLAGNERYESALKFDLPDVPDGDEVTSFRVSLPMEQPSFDMSSPMFQDLILAAFQAIGDQDPGIFAERLPEVLQEEPVAIDADVMGMEACPLLEPFEPGGAPEASHSDEIPRDEDTGEALVDCVVGSGAAFDEETERWTFDLTFAAEAWNSGELDNHGVLIRPTGGPNLAFGDPDTSTNAQIVLGIEDVTVAMDTAEPAPEVEALDDAPGLEDGGGDLGDEQPSDGMAFEEGEAPEDMDAGGEAGADMGDAPDVDGPEVADDVEGSPEQGEAVDEPAVASPQLDDATPAGGPVDAPWWIWLLVPAFAGGAYLVTNALTAPAAAAAGTGAGGASGGAMSRLISRGGGGPLNPA